MCTPQIKSAAHSGSGVMRRVLIFIFACVIGLTSGGLAQQPATSAKSTADKPANAADSALKDLFQAKIKAEWEALKNKDKKAYGDLLDDEYQGVEADGRGERNKVQAINEVPETNVYNYTLWGLKVIPVGNDAAFVIYEVTMQFPPKAQVRYSRIYVGSLWLKREKQWKELHYQETHVR